MTFRLLSLEQSLRSINLSPIARHEGKSLVYVPCILELEGLGGTLLEVAVLLIMHRKSRGGLRGDIGLEDCSGLGGGVVRKNIPLIHTTYILLAGREHESAQGVHDRRSMAKGRCSQKTLESRRVVVGNDSRLGS